MGGACTPYMNFGWTREAGRLEGEAESSPALVLPLFVGGLSDLLPLSQLSFLMYKIKGWTEHGWRSRLLGILADGLFLRFPFILTLVL